jgi:hypothetical protein
VVPFAFVGLSRKTFRTLPCKNRLGCRFKLGNNQNRRHEAKRLVILPPERRHQQPQYWLTSGKDEAQLHKNDQTTMRIPQLVAICFEGEWVFPKPSVASFPQPSCKDRQSFSIAEKILSSLLFNSMLPSKITIPRLVP